MRMQIRLRSRRRRLRGRHGARRFLVRQGRVHAFGRGVALRFARQARLPVWHLRLWGRSELLPADYRPRDLQFGWRCRACGLGDVSGQDGPAVKQRYEAMLEQDPDNARFKMLLDNWVAAKDHPTKEDLDNMAAAAKKAVLGE